tara:strand:+ start:2582 stop:2908 length:327 start_codon:yes stop_codon:yes gene_type:complete
LKLSIPIKHSTETFTLKNALIQNDFKWQKDHWKSIESSYKSSPFFEYYQDSLENIYKKKYNKLLDFNLDCIKLINEWLEIELKFNFTDSYKKKYQKHIDLRFKFRKEL